ncbi:MAG: phosphoribosylglycinamide formyltransferase [Bacteroidota bacterium]
MKGKARIAIFASGSGTNAEEIIKYFHGHRFTEIVLLLSNNSGAYALIRAGKYGVGTKVFTKYQFRESEEVLDWLMEAKITHLVLAGFLWLIPQNLVRAFPHRIINIHPALLPRHGGKGMYGMKVHQAVKTAGEKETGITIHEVNERYDEGQILFQGTCEVLSSDTPEQIADKVHQLEHAHYPKVIEKWIEA